MKRTRIKCCVQDCKSLSGSDGITMFKFPKDPDNKLLWTVFCENLNPNFSPNTGSRICMLHFEENLIRISEKYTRLEKGAVPTISNIQSETIDYEDSNACLEFSNCSLDCAKESNKSMVQEDSDYIKLDHSYAKDPMSEKSISVGDYQKLRSKHDKLKKELKRLKAQLRNQNKKILRNEKAKQKNHKFLTNCQAQILYKGKKYCRHWDKATIKRAIETRAACGRTGYEYLRKLGLPLPTVGHLNNKLKPLNFDPGILKDFILFLENAVKNMETEDRHAGLYFDEMSLVPAQEYDPSSKTVLGSSTFPGDNSEVTHALVFMVCGLRRRWKQIVAYHFTGTYRHFN